MRTFDRPSVFIALSIVWIGILIPASGTPLTGSKGRTGQGCRPAGVPTGDLPSCRPFIGPEIAQTIRFRSKGLSYVGSREFAESVRAVALRVSPFSPDPVPPGWKTTAAVWTICLTEPDAATPEGHLRPEFRIAPPDFPQGSAYPWRSGLPGEEASGIPALLVRASLDYRSKPGRDRASPLSRRDILQAAKEIRSWVDRQWEKCRTFEVRGMRIASKILLAEQLGARDLTPRDFALARAELLRARHVADTGHYTVTETGSAFDEADKAVNTLLDRAMDSIRGIRQDPARYAPQTYSFPHPPLEYKNNIRS